MKAGYKYDGATAEWDTSTGTEDLVKDWLEAHPEEAFRFKADNFLFTTNTESIQVQINGSETITLPPQFRFEEPAISSFKIMESGKEFHYFARY